MNNVEVKSKGYAWGRNRDVNLSGLHLEVNIVEYGVRFVRLHPIDTKGQISWSSYIQLQEDAFEQLALGFQTELASLGFSPARQAEPPGVLPDPILESKR